MNADIVALLGEGFIETVIMVIGSGVLGSIIGIPLGVLLHVTDKGGLMPKLATNAIVGVIVNAVRSTHPLDCRNNDWHHSNISAARNWGRSLYRSFG